MQTCVEDVRNILVLDKDETGDIIQAMIHMAYHGEYVVKKAESITEALHWLDTIPSYQIHMVLLGLSEQENRELVCYLEGVAIRDEYNLVMLIDETNRVERQPPLRVEGYVSKWPFRLKELLRHVERFAGRSIQLV